MDAELRQRSRQALVDGDLGEQVDDNLFIKDLGTITREPQRDRGEVALAEPIRPFQRKSLPERERLVGEIAARVMDDFINNLNDNTRINPIRDGIPACHKHPFPVGCVHGCQEGQLTRIRDYTLYDVFRWVQELAKVNYEALLRRRPELRGWQGGTI